MLKRRAFPSDSVVGRHARNTPRQVPVPRRSQSDCGDIKSTNHAAAEPRHASVQAGNGLHTYAAACRAAAIRVDRASMTSLATGSRHPAGNQHHQPTAAADPTSKSKPTAMPTALLSALTCSQEKQQNAGLVLLSAHPPPGTSRLGLPV